MDKIKIILAVPPEEGRVRPPIPCTIGHMAYKIGSGFRLYRCAALGAARSGLMVLSDNGYRGTGSPDHLARAILRECMARGFSGLLADFEVRSPLLCSLLDRVSGLFAMQRLQLYVPETFGNVKNANILVPSAISGGNLRRELEEAVQRYGASRVTLDVERICMDFTLPSHNGQGRRLDPSEFAALAQTKGGSSFFSRELGAYYFTYSDGRQAHFTLYDNAASLRQKLDLAAQLGIRSAVLFYPEVSDILTDICS